MKKNGKNQKKKIAKKRYAPPLLVEYGSVGEFTRAMTQGPFSDGGMVMLCPCIGSFSVIDEHRILLGDEICQSFFRKAIFEAVKPGDVVLDLGTGSGLHALFACQAGAKKVYAIESGTIIEVAKAVARENGFGDRIEFIYGLSSEVDLPEKVDVIITNVGFLPTIEHMPDAYKRFLKKGGRMIPSSIGLAFAPITLETLYRDQVSFWNQKRYGLAFSSFFSYASASIHAHHFSEKEFLAKSVIVNSFDLKVPQRPSYRWKIEFEIEKSGVFHGLAVWYSFKLSENVEMSTKPPLSMAPEIWRHPFLPTQKPVAVKRGDKIKVNFGFFPEKKLGDAVWSWTIEVNGTRTEQTSFNSSPLFKEYLAQLNP